MFPSGLTAITLLIAAVHISCQEIGESVCAEGYIMDIYCIDQGSLLDNWRVRTLENPGKHSLHCLLDVPFCVDSGYEVLLDPAIDGDLYTRGFRLDENGNNMVVRLARDYGQTDSCTTCTNKVGLSMTNGFRATVKGTITVLPDGEIPAIIAVTSVEDQSVGCGDATATDAPISTPPAGTTNTSNVVSNEKTEYATFHTPVEDPSLSSAEETEGENIFEVISHASSSDDSEIVEINATALANEVSGGSKVTVYWHFPGAILVLATFFA